MANIDLPRSRIEAVFKKRECPAIVRRLNRGYTIFYEDKAVTRIRQCGRLWEVLWWSHRDRRESIGDFGGMVFYTIEEAAEYVLDDRWAYSGSGPWRRRRRRHDGHILVAVRGGDDVGGTMAKQPKRFTQSTLGVQPQYTPRQGQFLAFIHYYTKLNGCPPAEGDMARYFKITPPSAHQMVVTLEQHGLIERDPGRSRSIRLLVACEDLPDL